jgi:hypothetical protein
MQVPGKETTMRKLIACPETAHLEVIEFDATELGTVIASCSRLARCKLQCTRVCAALLDCGDSLEAWDGPWSDDAGIVPLVIVDEDFQQPLDGSAVSAGR